MDIQQYLEKSGRTAADFAAAVGISAVSLSRISRGMQNTTRDVMQRIIAESGGAVTADRLVHAAADSGDEADQSTGKIDDLPPVPRPARDARGVAA